MENSRREKITLFVRYGLEEPRDLISSLRETADSEIDIIICSGSLRPIEHFPFIKDEEGRPYYGMKAGIFI